MTKNDALTDLRLDTIKACPVVYDNVKDTCFVTIEGVIDTYNSSDFKEKLLELFNAGFQRFILDCAGVKYVSSTGVGCLIAALKELRSIGGDLVLYKIPDEVYQVIQILGFAKIIKKFESKKEIDEYFGVKKEEPFTFPAIANCPACQKKLKVMHAGRYRCSECKNIFTVQANGDVILQVAALSPAKQ